MTPPPALPGVSTLTAPIDLAAQRPPWRQTFSSLKVPNFRLFAVAHLVAVIALWMQRIAQDWLVLQLSGSVTAVGITVAMQFAPSLLLMPLGGIIADRCSKRMILMISQGAAGVLAVVMAVLALSGAIQVWHIYGIAFLLGLVTVVDQPARQVFVNELVGPVQLRNAISVNSSIFQIGAMIGPAISGVLISAVGGGWAFAVNALACFFTVGTLARLRTRDLLRSAPAPRSKGQLREGLDYAMRKPTIFWPAVMAGFIAVFAMSLPVLMAAYANTVFYSGAGGYGLLNTLVAVGALAGAVASTRRPVLRLRTVVGAAGSYGMLLVLAAAAPSMWIFCAVLVAAGYASLTFLTSSNQLVQISTNVRIRGRVMSLYIIVLIGGQAIGGPLIGALAEHLGPQWAMVVAGTVPGAAAALIAVVLARRGHLTLRVDRKSRRRPVLIVRRRETGELGTAG
ncbi:MFS transporter [Arthrobacter sp. A5]|uniref:MFS transporter n=1 Tax=Arthrobacter sp. A5 TaxID=576926 RepID=UPI003DA96125